MELTYNSYKLCSAFEDQLNANKNEINISEYFSPHARFPSNYIPRENAIGGWNVCEEAHFKELPFDCISAAQYLHMQLFGMTVTDLVDSKSESRPVTVGAERKSRAKSTNTLTLRKSKSVRNVDPIVPRSWVRSQTTRYVTRFPLLFSGIREIKYTFKPYPYHEQHLDVYRNAYTFVLIRNFRQLRESGSPNNRRCGPMQISSAKLKASEKQYMPQSSAGQYHGNIVYYSDSCQTGPVCANASDRNVALKPSDILSSGMQSSNMVDSSAITNTFFLPKSTMEINSITLLPSQQKPLEGECLKSKMESVQLKSKRGGGDIHDDKKSNSLSIYNTKVTGKSPFPTKNKQGGTPSKKISTTGKIPVSIRRSSPSIKGKQDQALAASEYLSIAVGTHTVASPYHHVLGLSDEKFVSNYKI